MATVTALLNVNPKIFSATMLLMSEVILAVFVLKVWDVTLFLRNMPNDML